MRVTPVLGLLLVVAGGLLVLFAPAASTGEPIQTASIGDAPPPEPQDEPGPSLAFMALGAALGLTGLAILAYARRRHELAD